MKQIILRGINMLMFFGATAFLQAVGQKPVLLVTGMVTNQKNEPLSGAAVQSRSGHTYAITNTRGEFSIRVHTDDDSLVISYVGYKTQTRYVGSERKMTINMLPDAESQQLSDVVVVGFGKQKKINLTGAVTQISGDRIDNRPVTNIGQALQGTIPNLNITTTGDPGGPGQPASFNIRGNTSLTGGGPLLVVDGMTVSDINNLNPADIESITVLKDAGASAIYGARAPYGVIMITTKGGKLRQKAIVTYNGLAGQSSYTTLPVMANSLQFARAFNDASVNTGQAPAFSDEILQELADNIARPGSHPVSTPDPQNPGKYTYASPLNVDNVDWFKAYFQPWTYNHKHDLSIQGGNQSTSYYLGAGYYSQGGLLRYAHESFKRYNLISNVHTEPTSWLRLDVKARFNRTDKDVPYEYASQLGNWVHQVTTRQPNWALRNPDGHFSHASNLEFLADGGRRINTDNNLTLIGSVEAEPIKGWKINLDYSYNYVGSRYRYHSAYVYAWDTAGGQYNIGPNVNSVGEGTTSQAYNTVNFYSSYEKRVNKHYFRLLLGQQTEVFSYFDASGIKSDLITDAIPAINTATGVQNVFDQQYEWATSGTFGRLNYNYDEKYLLEVNARYDGTSRFPQNKRFGLFPSISAGYILSKEKYWDAVANIVNTFKIRASYGSLGNQNVGLYPYLATVPIGTNENYILNNIRPSFLGVPGLISSNLTWETARTVDVGLDAEFLHNRLSLTFDYYRRNTLNMLGPSQALPAVVGTSLPLQNNANLLTKGFELSLGWRDVIGKDLHYNITVLLSDYTSVVKKYYNPTGILSTYFDGYKLGDIWGFQTQGLIQTQDQLDKMSDQSYLFGRWNLGDVMYGDLNGDGKIDIGKNTVSDHGDLKVIGNNTPRYSYSVTLNADWKGFDLNIFLQGVAKRNLWLGGNRFNNSGNIFWGFVPNFGNNVYKTTLDYWTPDNTDAYWPKPYLSSEMAKNHYEQTRYLQTGAYLRLKNIQLGYDLTRLMKVKRISKLRVYGSAENILTFSGINKNFDPEVVDGGWGTGKIYPLFKTISFGLTLVF